MTIKQFAHLCGCNPQTLRYYDHIGLLKPAKVDPFSGYRHYEAAQAVAFVKIKSLQQAGFSIAEIKALLQKDSAAVFLAFNEKIAAQERRLREIKAIQRSYQEEMTHMRQKLDALKGAVLASVRSYDPEAEFGLDQAAYDALTRGIIDHIDGLISRNGASDLAFTPYHDGDGEGEEADEVNLLSDPDLETVYERHGWLHVKEFFHDLPALDDGRDYDMLFHLLPGKADSLAFAHTALALLERGHPQGPNSGRSLGCHVSLAKDGQNHFWLLKRKA